VLTAVSTSLAHPLCGRPLALVVASASAVEAVASGAADELAILPPIHISGDDSYLVVSAGPDVYGEAGLRRILAGAVVVRGELQARPGAAMLSIAERFRTEELFDRKPFDVIVPLRFRRPTVVCALRGSCGSDLLEDLDRIPIAESARGRLFDASGLERILRSRDLVGKSWELCVPERDVRDAPDPTWAWSRRGTKAVSIHLMVFGDYEERYALINPIQLLLPGGPMGNRGRRPV
jgi:hypothetical protein